MNASYTSGRRQLGFCLAVLLLATNAAFAAVTLVKDIKTDFNAASASPADLIHINGVTYFYAQDDVRGYELWKSDGTEAGTVLVKDIRPGSGDSSPRNFVNVNGTLFFTANDGVHSQGLWKSDGTEAGTVMVKDVGVVSYQGQPGLVAANGTLFFAGYLVSGDYNLWKSDGTEAGTVLVRSFPDPDYPRDPAVTKLVAGNGMVFFQGATTGGASANYGLWRSDGTANGTILLLSGGAADNFVNVNGTLFFTTSSSGIGTELWKSDGTTNGTVLIKDIRAGSGSSSPANLATVNGTLFFAANDGTNGIELWKSDGTTNGTVMVKDIVAGSGSSSPVNLANINGTLFFSATDGTNGFELWKSDGTSDGTSMVKNIATGSNDSDPADLTDVNGTLFFAANGSGGIELWKSDGTSNGTIQVKDIRPGSNASSPSELVNASGTLLFEANDGVHGSELWRSDGTTNGTFMVKDIRGGTLTSSPENFADVNGTLFFAATTTNNGVELWKSDGTESGTVLVKDIQSGTGSSSPASLVNVNGALFFTATTTASGTELWKSEGTTNGTVIVKEIQAGTGSSSPDHLVNANGSLFLTATSSGFGVELWKSDGTTNGTVLVKDIRAGSSGSAPDHLVNLNGILFFSANDGTNGVEFWKSDGTDAGTVMVSNISPTNSSASPDSLVNVNGTLFFTANNATNGVELWKSDGSESGTMLVKDIRAGATSTSPTNLVNMAGTLFFTANDGTSGAELWKSDGTSNGTVMVKNIVAGSGSSNPRKLTPVNGTLFFVADNNTNGFELWKSDGTSNGTVMVKDIRAGPLDSNPANLVNLDGTLFFTADDGINGIELWQSDGTEAGTLMVADTSGNTGDGSPVNLTVVAAANRTLFFAATTQETGQELFAYFADDFGDAPTNYPTKLADNGARHAIPPGGPMLYLGASAPDGETDAAANATATGDNATDNNDEDGVALPAFLNSAQTQSATVVVTGSGGVLNAWVDWNKDGDWSDAGEQVFANQAVVAGTNLLSFTVPTLSISGSSFARFRLSSATGLSPTGAAPDGEVEDYQVTLNLPPTLSSLTATNVGQEGAWQTSYSFAVTFSDDHGIAVSSLDVNDVTVTGPGGPLLVSGVSESTGSSGSPRTATYTVTPPGGSWNDADNGTYSIALAGNQVADVGGLFVPANVSLATFTVNMDTTPPVTTITNHPPAQTNSAAASFAFIGTDGNGTGVAAFEFSLDGSAFAPATNPKTLSGLSDGSHTFQVRAIDMVGNVETNPASYTWTVDTTPPETMITSQPPSQTNGASAVFTFTGDDGTGTGVAGFETSLDGSAFVPAASPQILNGLSDGSHTFRVRARDAVNNVDATLASHTWTVDTTPPQTTITSRPPNQTNSTSAVFTFSGDDGSGTGVAGFEFRLEGGLFAAATSPQSVSGLAAGSHTLEARAHDAVGNADATPASYTWTVDLTPPTVSIGSPSAAVATLGESVSFAITYAGADTVLLSDGDVALNATGTASATATVSGSGATARTVTVANLDGAGTVGISLATATASDIAGNAAAAAGPSATFQMLQPPPSILHIQNFGGGTFVITFSGLSNRTYRIQSANALGPPTNLEWQSLGPAIVNGVGLGSFTNLSSTESRYYRTIFP